MNPDTALPGLDRRFRIQVFFGGLVIAAGGVALAAAAGARTGLAGTGLALVIWLYLGMFVGGRLGLNRRAGETGLLSTFGPGTSATLLRGWLLACLAGFLLMPRLPGVLAWAPAGIYALADVADYLDGYLARVSGHATLLGEALDIELDALGLLIAVAIAVAYSALPIWYLAVGLARYTFILGLWARQRTGKPVYSLPPSDSRRPLAGLQMGALCLILFPVLQPPVTTVGGVILAIPLLIGFARDWFVVSGMIDPGSAVYRGIRRRVKRVLLHWSPVVMRALVVASTVGLGSIPAEAQVAADAGSLVRGSLMFGGWYGPLRVVELGAAAAVGLGVSPQLAAALLVGSLLLRAAGGASSPTLLVALAGAIAVLMAGGGAFSIWRPEIQWLSRRAGEE